jgi:hypothetical protein
MSETLTAHDEKNRYCPRLGHEVPFGYCRRPGSELPCRTLAGCWGETFDVEAFLACHFTSEQRERMAAPPPDRACTLVELIERARQASKAKE